MRQRWLGIGRCEVLVRERARSDLMNPLADGPMGLRSPAPGQRWQSHRTHRTKGKASTVRP